MKTSFFIVCILIMFFVNCGGTKMVKKWDAPRSELAFYIDELHKDNVAEPTINAYKSLEVICRDDLVEFISLIPYITFSYRKEIDEKSICVIIEAIELTGVPRESSTWQLSLDTNDVIYDAFQKQDNTDRYPHLHRLELYYKIPLSQLRESKELYILAKNSSNADKRLTIPINTELLNKLFSSIDSGKTRSSVEMFPRSVYSWKKSESS